MSVYGAAKAILHSLMRVYFRSKYEGRENIPFQGGCIIAANHMSYVDPPLVGAGCPRPVNFMAKAELFSMPFLSWILPRIRAFPVQRGAADRKAIRRALQLLEEGEVIGVFPEGTRNRANDELLPPQGGAALLALKAGVPVVPAAVWGTSDIDGILHLPRPVRIGVRYGQPIHLNNVENVNKEAVKQASQQIMAAIHELLNQ